VRHAVPLVPGGAQMTHHTNRKAPRACDSEGLHNDTTDDLNFATGMRHSKAEATQIAELAIWGHAVRWLKDGGFLVCKYGHTFHAIDFAELQAFASRLGVTA
jgi:hypothetical protein